MPRHPARLAVAAIALVVALALALPGPFNRYFFDENLIEIVPGEIWRSAQPSGPELDDFITRLDLRTVLNLRGERGGSEWYRQERAVTEARDVELHTVRLSAKNMPPTPRLREIIRVFDTAPRPLLLHCQGGVERSGLVGAVAVLLHGGTLEEARAQFAPSKGYIAFISRSELPQVLDEYEEWLAARGEPHSADHFRAWVAEDYHPYFYRAGIAPVEVPATWAAGVETVLRFQVTNRSKRPIPFQSSPERGVHLGAFVHAEGDGDAAPRELRAGFVDLELAPGASATLDLAVPPLPPGAFRLEVDLVDEGYKWFQAMGSEPLSLRFEVLGEG